MMRTGFIARYPDPQLDARPALYRAMGVEVLDVQAAELDDDVRALVARARDAGVPVCSLRPRWGWRDRALNDGAEIERMVAFIRVLPSLGITSMNMSCSMVVPRGETGRQEHVGRVVETMRTVCRAAEAEGVDLCSHTTLFRRGILFGTVEGVDAFLTAAGSPRNRLLLWCGCVSAAGEDVPALIYR